MMVCVCMRVIWHHRFQRCMRYMHPLSADRVCMCNWVPSSPDSGFDPQLSYCRSLVTRAGRLAPSIPLRLSLHWLPISFRIQFKIHALIYKALSCGKPSYLANLIHLATLNKNLRFNKGPLLSAPKCKTKTGTRVFSVCAPSLWNKLPMSILSSESLTCFLQCLRTHLLGLAYPP